MCKKKNLMPKVTIKAQKYFFLYFLALCPKIRSFWVLGTSLRAILLVGPKKGYYIIGPEDLKLNFEFFKSFEKILNNYKKNKTLFTFQQHNLCAKPQNSFFGS